MALTRLALKAKTVKNSKDPSKLQFVGYSGGPVDLQDHGLDEQAVYDLETTSIKNQKMRMMYNHRTAVGHTTTVINNGKTVEGDGTLSVDNKITNRIKNAAKNEFPFEMSMGVDARKIVVEYFPEGVIANGRKFKKPTYLLKNGVIDEMTICEEGRDSKTSLRLLNSKLSKAELLKIKNSVEDEDDLEEEDEDEEDDQLDLEDGEDTEPSNKKKVLNMPKRKTYTPPSQKIGMGDVARLLNKYPEHNEVIAKGLDLNWSKSRILNAIKVRRLENALPEQVKVGKAGATHLKELEARIVNACCSNPEKTLEKHYGKEIRDKVMNQPTIGVKEFLVLSAQQMGERGFNGHSDISRLMNFVGNYNKANLGRRIENAGSGFSTFDMPNFFARTTQIVFEEAWMIGGFFAKDMCYKTSQSNFKKTQRFRPTGGTMWEGLDQDGKIKHASFGKEVEYETTLDTKAQMLMINRVIAQNDDFGAIKELLGLMVEGAMMVPDYKLVQRMLQANGAFFTAYAADTTTGGSGTGNNMDAVAITETNLELAYNLASERTTEKGRVNWIDDISDEWTIVVTTKAQEKQAWDIVGQPEYVSNTTASTKQVKKNYWYNKFAVKRFPQLSNLTFNSQATRDRWFLWPSKKVYAPFAINWLNGVERPIVETVDAPVDMLGFGTRGYIDVDINDREPLAIVRMNGVAAPT